MIFFAAFILALVLTTLCTPLSIRLARTYDVMDYPRARKVHRQPLPRWGGIAIFAGCVGSFALLALVFPQLRALLSFKQGELARQMTGIAAGGTLVFVLGLIDDKRSVQALTKLLTQIIAAYIAIDYGVRITGIGLPFDGAYHQFPIMIGQALTVFWIIGFMNTINLADGLDGMAAGIVAIASATFFIVALLQLDGAGPLLARQLTLAAVLSAMLAGACLGFLIFNFNPAKVFMGDSGALFLGFMLAVICVVGTLKSTAVMAILVPVTAVALPILDVALALFRRMRKGTGLMTPDKDHIHHRLLRYGWTHREVVLLMYIFSLLLAIGAILLTVSKVFDQ